MISLTIRKPDNSIYWVEHFNSQQDADKWLAEEQTRPYWQSGGKEVWTSTFVDETHVQTPQEVAEINALKSRKQSRSQTLLSISSKSNLNNQDMQDAIMALIQKSLEG